MKKLFVMLVAVALFGGVAKVNAMSEDELYNKLTKSYTINGETYKVSDAVKKQIKDYLKDFEVSSKDADYISGKVDELVKTAEKSNVKPDEIPATVKTAFIEAVRDVAANTSVNATISEGNDGLVLTVLDENGEVYSKIDNADVTIRKTGSEAYIVMIAGAISVIGFAVIAKKVAKGNA